jgi:dihydrofolate synthase/folylpolyglutamate synthase
MAGSPEARYDNAIMGAFRDFEEAFHYIKQFTNYERMRTFRYSREALDLERVRAVLNALGRPDARYPIVHVAGTKGKGSACAMIASILERAGLHVGLFSKPHLVRLNERISVNGRDISDEAFTRAMNVLYPHLEAQRRAGRPLTFFDLITVLALVHFAEAGVDVVVLETGLGGRLDSTNVVTPTVTAITTIDYDHTHILGETLEEIAAEKAGILKPVVPAISGVLQREPAEVIERTARERSAPLFALSRDFRLIEPAEDGTFVVETWRRRYTHLELSLLGAHQRRNAAVAVAALEALSEALRLELSDGVIREGLRSTRLRGRIEVISEEPTVILDVAHNPSSLRALRETLQSCFPEKRVVLLLGMSDDKDARGCLREILLLASAAVFTSINHPRGIDPERLREIARELRPELPCEVRANISEGLERARALTRREDLLCITGSFYLAGEVAAVWPTKDLDASRG